MTGLIDAAMSRARMIVALIILSIVAGGYSYMTLPKEGAPNIDIPVLYVSVNFPGVSALDAERLLVRPLEEKLQGIDGLKDMTGVASEGHASVALEFDFGFDKDVIVAEVQKQVDEAAAGFPDGANEPRVIEISTSEFPILVISLAGEVPERVLLRLAKQIQTAVETAPPVLEATLSGQREELLELIIDPIKLEGYGLVPSDILRAVNNNNMVVAAGAVEAEEGRFSVKLPGAIETLQQVYDLPLVTNGARVVTVQDVAEVRRTFEDRSSYARFNGEPTIALSVKKRAGENIIATVQMARGAAKLVMDQWPQELRDAVSVTFSLDESVGVRDMMDQLVASVVTAIALVMVVVVAALGLRSAGLVGFAIPTSFLLTFALLQALGMSVNNMVMFGLILAVGILVDGAIVIVEYAERRVDEGAPPEEAFSDAGKRMFWPIVSSTATTLCAFLPMLLWPGMPGQFMRYLPITLIFVLAASLLVALIFLPVVGSIVMQFGQWIRRSVLDLKPRKRVPRLVLKRRRSLFGWFSWMIAGNPIAPFVVIGATVFALMTIFSVYGEKNFGVEFFVETDPERANLYVSARGNLSVDEKNALMQVVERRLDGLEHVDAMFVTVGKVGDGKGGDTPADAIGSIQFEFADWRNRPKGREIMADIERRVANIPGLRVDLAEQAEGPQQGKPIQLQISGLDLGVVDSVARRVRTQFETQRGLTGVEDTLPLPGIEWALEVDREEAARYGADIASVGPLVQMATRGALIGTYRPDDSDDEIEIRARFPVERRSIETIDSLRVRTPSGLSPLSNFVSRAPASKLAEITRVEGLRSYTVKSDVEATANANEEVAELQAWLDAETWPQGVRFKFLGDQQEQAESMAFLGMAFAGALFMMFIILLAQFNSFYNAVLVLLAVIFSVGGALVGMLVMGQPFSIIMTGIGIVSLAGIVVNNNIVLIDTYQELSQTMPRLEAIVETCEQRLRPVLLTTITTIAGLLPMTFAVSLDMIGGNISVGAPSSLWWMQLATAIVFGLGFATVLTLVVTPALLALRIWAGTGMRWIGRRVSMLIAPNAQSNRLHRAMRAVSRVKHPVLWSGVAGPSLILASPVAAYAPAEALAPSAPPRPPAPAWLPGADPSASPEIYRREPELDLEPRPQLEMDLDAELDVLSEVLSEAPAGSLSGSRAPKASTPIDPVLAKRIAESAVYDAPDAPWNAPHDPKRIDGLALWRADALTVRLNNYPHMVKRPAPRAAE